MYQETGKRYLMAESENKVRDEVRGALKKMGWFIFHIHQKGYRCYPGISDYIAIRRGRHVFLEIKTGTGKLSKAQRDFERNIKEQGGEYIVATGIDDLMAANMLT